MDQRVEVESGATPEVGDLELGNSRNSMADLEQ